MAVLIPMCRACFTTPVRPRSAGRSDWLSTGGGWLVRRQGGLSFVTSARPGLTRVTVTSDASAGMRGSHRPGRPFPRSFQGGSIVDAMPTRTRELWSDGLRRRILRCRDFRCRIGAWASSRRRADDDTRGGSHAQGTGCLPAWADGSMHRICVGILPSAACHWPRRSGHARRARPYRIMDCFIHRATCPKLAAAV